MNKFVIALMMSFIFSALFGCSVGKGTIAEPPPPHPHYYPFTKVLGKTHHVRLIVDHAEGEMALLFEDISENPVKIIRAQRIVGEVKMPDNRMKEEIFQPVDVAMDDIRVHRRRALARMLRNRLAGDFVSQGEWIKTTPQFDLTVTVPFQGADYTFTFHYMAPGGSIPYHRKPLYSR